jgi:hypothetical protein
MKFQHSPRIRPHNYVPADLDPPSSQSCQVPRNLAGSAVSKRVQLGIRDLSHEPRVAARRLIRVNKGACHAAGIKRAQIPH